MSPDVGFSMPLLLWWFLVWRVTDQSLASGTPLTTRRGKVSGDQHQQSSKKGGSDKQRLGAYSAPKRPRQGELQIASFCQL
jgi:hypothetical protein